MTDPIPNSIHADLTFEGPPEQLRLLKIMLEQIGADFPGVTANGQVSSALLVVEATQIGSESTIMNMPIQEFMDGGDDRRSRALHGRTSQCLKRAQIATVGDLVKNTEAELLRINNFGETMRDLVKTKLAERGLALKTAPTY